MNNIKKMKALVLTMTMALTMLAGNLQAQYDDEKYGIQPWFGGSSLLDKESQDIRDTYREDEGIGVLLPSAHGVNSDYDAPLGSGVVVLLGLGAAYLIGKKRDEE